MSDRADVSAAAGVSEVTTVQQEREEHRPAAPTDQRHRAACGEDALPEPRARAPEPASGIVHPPALAADLDDVTARMTMNRSHDSADASPARAVAEREVVDLLDDDLLAPPGPPPVITYTWSKTWNPLMSEITTTKNVDGRQQRQGDRRTASPRARAVHLRRLDQLAVDRLQAGEQDDHDEAEVLPRRRQDDGRASPRPGRSTIRGRRCRRSRALC